MELANKLKKDEWISFFNFYLRIDEIKKETFVTKIESFKETQDKDLRKLINKIAKNI